MSFAGVSVVADAQLLNPSSTAPAIYSGKASSGSWWYHLLVVEGYRWALKLCPNGDRMETAGFISVFLVLHEDVALPLNAHWQFSFVDQVDRHELACIRATNIGDFSKSGHGWGHYRFIKREDLEKSEHLKNDCFTIRCDFIITQAVDTFIEVPSSNICDHLNHLLVTKLGADVKFEVGSETFDAHRCVLAARSAVFRAELFGPMKEGTTADAIQIQDIEPNVFKALLGFIYTDSMPKMDMGGVAGEAGADVLWMEQLLVAADKYDLQRLKSMCEDRLLKHINLSSVSAILGVAAQHHCHELKEACLELLKLQSADGLRDVMATSDWQHISTTDPSVLNELITKLALKANP
uniref:Speckle-type POZ protein-like protein A n=1 Tax=Aegilops tauschii TaxID=37682 RepID=M8BSN3_AEGTA